MLIKFHYLTIILLYSLICVNCFDNNHFKIYGVLCLEMTMRRVSTYYYSICPHVYDLKKNMYLNPHSREHHNLYMYPINIENVSSVSSVSNSLILTENVETLAFIIERIHPPITLRFWMNM